jgi:hypothetical protein
MSFTFCDLGGTTRGLMLSEVEADIASGTLTESRRFSAEGTAAYPDLLREAVRVGDEDTLRESLASGPYFVAKEWVNKEPNGYWKSVPSTAAQTFAEGEFNRFFVRGLALEALSKGDELLEVYRAKLVADPRPESEALIGASFQPASLLTDLRANQGVETAIGLARPNSGLSARIKGLPEPCVDASVPPSAYRAGCALCMAARMTS